MKNTGNKEQFTADALQKQLANAGINTSSWGTGQAKTLAHLQNEIENGEAILITGEIGELLRKVVVVAADIYYQLSDGQIYRLKEDRQVFKDGRERRRGFGHAVSEKIKTDEDPRTAMIRGIKEELGISGEIFLTETGTEEQVIASPSYPGLKSHYIHHKFEATLTEEQFKPDGYKEVQADKTTFFVWEEVE